MASAQGVQSYYLALALSKLGQGDRAEPLLQELISFGKAALAQASEAAEIAPPARTRQSPRTRTVAA